MPYKQLTSPSNEPIVLEASKVIAVRQQTTTALDKTSVVNCYVFYADLEESGFLVKGDVKSVMRQLGLFYTFTP